ncbi:MAG: hypothetical protein R2745_08400 [Vicinamibacterales bacterium]
MPVGWLSPLCRALDGRRRPILGFVRDDDAGWADDRLAALLDVTDLLGCPIDLAVIPAEATPERAAWLLARKASARARIGLHQHGWAHANHEPSGRPCEFGPSRSVAGVRADLARGGARLRDLFGQAWDPIFTPPWNRCTAVVGPLLVELGVAVLSRDRSAGRLGVPGLLECPVSLDWFARDRGVRLTREAWIARAADAVSDGVAFGLMLHHAPTDDGELEALADVLSLLVRHPAVELGPLLEVARAAAGPHAAEGARA